MDVKQAAKGNYISFRGGIWQVVRLSLAATAVVGGKGEGVVIELEEADGPRRVSLIYSAFISEDPKPADPLEVLSLGDLDAT